MIAGHVHMGEIEIYVHYPFLLQKSVNTAFLSRNISHNLQKHVMSFAYWDSLRMMAR